MGNNRSLGNNRGSARAHNPGCCSSWLAAACRLPEPLWVRSSGKFCPDVTIMLLRGGTSIRRIGQAPPTTEHCRAPSTLSTGEGGEGWSGKIPCGGARARARWRVDGGFPEQAQPGRRDVPFKGHHLLRVANRVADNPSLVAADIITALVHLFQALVTSHAPHPNIPPRFHSSESNFQRSPQTLPPPSKHPARSLPRTEFA